MTKRSFGFVAVTILAVGASMAISAAPRERGRSREHRAVDLQKQIGETLAAATMFATDDGRLEIWGVRSMDVDDDGRTTVHVKTTGDILSAPVVVVEALIGFSSEGTLSVGGIESLNSNGDTLTIVFRPYHAHDVVASGHEIGGEECEFNIPLPPNPPNPYCAGPCPTSRPFCEPVIRNQVLVCDCVSLPQ